MRKTNKKGFTIVELVIVIAVIAILAAVMIPTFAGVVDKANKSAAEQEAAAAYKEAFADAVADGKIATTITTGEGDEATTTETNKETVISGELAFVFTSADRTVDKITSIEVFEVDKDGKATDTPAEIKGYTINITPTGVVSAVKPTNGGNNNTGD